MTVQTLTFPFLLGLQQSVDDRLLDPGRPRAIENLAIAKRGRLRMRQDYDALAMTVQGIGTFTLYDLIAWNNRLLGLGESSSSGYTPSPCEIFEHVDEPLYAWRRSCSNNSFGATSRRMPVVTYPRKVGRIPGTGNPIVSGDVAAGNGRVCMVLDENTILGRVTLVHVFDPITDATLLFSRVVAIRTPRVVCVGGVFFIAAIDTAETTPKLFRFNPASDTALVALTDPAGAGAAILCLDLSVSREGTSFWLAYGRTGSTTRVHGFDSTGTETHDFAGPAVLADAITVYTQAANGTQRIHVGIVIDATLAVHLATYLGATSALETNTPAFGAGAISQVGIATAFPTTAMVMIFTDSTGIARIQFLPSTHAAGTLEHIGSLTMATKLLNIGQRAFFGAITAEGTDAATHLLLSSEQTNFETVTDRLVASQQPLFKLPNMAEDTSTGRAYWLQSTLGQARNTYEVLRFSVEEQQRRQAAALGDTLYMAGGITCAFDGKALSEAGFLDRPVITSVTQAVSGSLTALGTYQLVAVYEYIDANGNRIQSPPSDVFEETLAGAADQLIVFVRAAHSIRRALVQLVTQDTAGLDSAPVIVIYRTRNAADGNLTLFRDIEILTITGVGEIFNGSCIQSDASLEDNEVLYSQGERGAQSGPLPFLAPEPCGVMWPSADRILSGQLPSSANIQESRPLLTGEQANWSDSIGFFRATRGRILAVARLDERRIIWTETEIFEMDGEGVDDNGLGTIGAPRRLPSDCGIYAPPGAPETAWQSIVECQLGIFFRGTETLIYLLPRGGVTPAPIGLDVQDRLAAFPNVAAAVYVPTDQTVRYVCNNSGNTDSLQLIWCIEEQTWITEGPYGAATLSACAYQGRMTTLRGNVVQQQRSSLTPAALIANAWRSGVIHGGGLGAWIRALNAQFYGEYRGDCALRCIFTFDDLTTETLTAEVNAVAAVANANQSNVFLATYTATTLLSAGSPYSFKFHPGQIKCESCKVDFEIDVPFPVVVFLSAPFGTTTSSAMALFSGRQIGDRVVVAFTHAADPGTPPAAAGWTLRSSSITHTVLERILDGSEVSPVTFTWTNSTAVAGVAWTIRHSHPTDALEVSTNTLASGTTVSSSALTPSWGLANTLWLAALAASERPTSSSAVNLRQNPDAFRRGIAQGFTSAAPGTGCQAFGCDRALRASALTPGSWQWVDTSPAVAMTIAVRPNPSLASAGLDYHYWTLDIESAGKSALKSPLQMG